MLRILDWLILPASTRELQRLNKKHEEFNLKIKSCDIIYLWEVQNWINEQRPKYHKSKYKLFETLVKLFIEMENKKLTCN